MPGAELHGPPVDLRARHVLGDRPRGSGGDPRRDATKAAEVAGRLRLTSGDMLELGIVDEVIGEDQEALDEAVDRALQEATAGDLASGAGTQ